MQAELESVQQLQHQLACKYRRFARVSRLLLLTVGLWPIRRAPLAYRFLPAFIALSLVMLSLTALSQCYAQQLSDIDQLTRAFSWCLSNWTLLIKVILFVVHRDRLLDISESLGKSFEDELKNSHLDSLLLLLLQRLSVFKCAYYTMILALAISFSLFAATPLAFIVTERKFTLVYPGKYPFELAPGSGWYYAIYAYEASLAGLFFCVGCGTDSLFGLRAFQLSGELRLLAARLGQLQPASSHHGSSGAHADQQLQLRRCLDKHEMLLRCRDDLQRVFGLMIIWLYVTISLVLCEYVYRISKMPFELSFSQLVMYFTFATKFLQAFTYAYCGSAISNESANVIWASYSCEWPGSGDKRFMRDILMLLTQRPIDLRFCNYFCISMEMFLKIANATVSYFFLLRTLDN